MNVFINIFSLELRKIFSYRVNFWVQYFASVIGEIFVSYVLWRAIFDSNQFTQLGGMSFSQMMHYSVYAALLMRLIRGPENFQVSEEIYSGSLTRYLIYPVNFLAFKLAGHFAHIVLTIFQFFIGLAVVLWLTPLVHASDLSFYNVVLALSTAITASFFYYFVLLAIEYVSFWADNVWCLNVIFRFIMAFLSGFFVPLALMPEWLQTALKKSPFPAMGDVPIRAMMGQVSTDEVLMSQMMLLVWFVPVTLILTLLWRAGTREYTAVGQ